MKKRILAMLLSTAMVATMAAGCGSTAEESAPADEAATTEEATEASADSAAAASDIALDGTWPAETIKIGVEVFDASDDQILEVQKYYSYLEEHFNIEFVYSESIADADAELAFIDSCAVAGCKGIIGYYNISQAQAAKNAGSQGMYYWGCEDSIYDEMKDDPMYVGRYVFAGGEDGQNGDYLGGYELAMGLAENGCKHVFYCNGGASMGVQMFIDRQEGFIAGIAAAQEAGYEIQYDSSADVVEGWPDAADFGANVTTKLTGDYDGVAAAFNAAALFQPISEAGKMDSMKIATIGEVCDTYYDLVQAGVVSTVVYDCEEEVFSCAVADIINAVNGHEDLYHQADGTASRTPVCRWTITDVDAYNAIYDYHNAGNFFISAEEFATCFPEFNADVTYDSICDMYSSLDVETAAAKVQ